METLQTHLSHLSHPTHLSRIMDFTFTRFSSRGLFTALAFETTHFRSTSSKLAIFNLEGGLLKIRERGQSKKKLTWISESVPSRLKELYDDEGYEIVIIVDKKTKKYIEEMGEMLYAALEIPLVFVGGHTDPFYKKPHIGLWKLIFNDFCRKQVFKNKCIYVGYSDIDEAFAWNAGLEFTCAHDFWKVAIPHPIPNPIPNPHPHPLNGLIEIGDPPQIMRSNIHQLVVTIGAGASGKNRISHHLELFHDYERINAWRSKTPVFQLKYFSRASEKNQSIVIDNSNPIRINRARWIAMAKDGGYYTTIVYIDIPRRAAEYLNNYRYHNGSGSYHYHTAKEYDDYYSTLEPPIASEADEIIIFDRLYVPDEAKKEELMSLRF